MMEYCSVWFNLCQIIAATELIHPTKQPASKLTPVCVFSSYSGQLLGPPLLISPSTCMNMDLE